jgi:hypothetical protein
MTRWRGSLSFALGLVSFVAILVIASSTAALPRELATLIIVAGPGMAWVPLLDLRDFAFEALLWLLCSVAAVILVAQVVTYAAGFSWRPVAFSLLGITVAGLAAQALVSLLSTASEES